MNFHVYAKQKAAQRSAQAIDRESRVSGHSMATEHARERAFATLPKDGSEDFTGYPRLPEDDPTDPLHPAKTERVDEVEENADSRLRRDGSESVEGRLHVYPTTRPASSVYEELYAYYGTSVQTIKQRFVQEGRWGTSIATSSWGFAFYDADVPDSTTYTKVWASDFETGGGVTLSSRSPLGHTHNDIYYQKSEVWARSETYTRTEIVSLDSDIYDWVNDNFSVKHTHPYAASGHGHSDYAQAMSRFYNHWHVLPGYGATDYPTWPSGY